MSVNTVNGARGPYLTVVGGDVELDLLLFVYESRLSDHQIDVG